MRIVEVEGLKAIGAVDGVRREVSLLLLEPDRVARGDHVLVHNGFATQRITAEDAQALKALYATAKAR